jgi:23S rRNA pseudouridine2604 synthase
MAAYCGAEAGCGHRAWPAHATQSGGDSSSLQRLLRCKGEIAPYGLRKLNHGLHYNGRALPPCKVSWQKQLRLRFAIKGVKGGQLRHMCKQVGLDVAAICRLRIGKVSLAKMPVGMWRYLPVGERF